jgi:hypothetical protein
MRQDKQQAMTTRAAVFIDVVEAIGLLALVVGGLLALAVAIVPAAEPPVSAPAPGASASDHDSLRVPAAAPVDSFAVTADTSLVFVLEIGSRLYPEWKETRRVRLHERFVIGDTDNAAVLTRLLPDFRILEGGPCSVSPNLANPAVRVYVYRGEARTDSAWAFLNFPPHFSRKSILAFQVLRIDFAGRPSVHAKSDSAGSPAPMLDSPLKPEGTRR